MSNFTGKYKIGDKVIPISKSTGMVDFENEGNWNAAKRIKQPFLYVNFVESNFSLFGLKAGPDPTNKTALFS
jgi:hypothetical protein